MRNPPTQALVALLCAAASMLVLAPRLLAEEPGADPNPAEIERVLRESTIVDASRLPRSAGVTRPWRLELELEGRRRACLWKSVDGPHEGVWEGWRYEVAAYELDKLLGLGMVPPTVAKSFEGKEGSCQLWVDYWVSERERQTRKIEIPWDRVRDWNRQMALGRWFDDLIANEDRHQGNLLVTKNWTLVLIDHSRSFRSTRRATRELLSWKNAKRRGARVPEIPRALFRRLESLGRDELETALRPFLTDEELDALLARRALVVRKVRELVREHGELRVLY